MRFKAKIEGLAYEGTGGSAPHIIPLFVFSWKKIWFTGNHLPRYYTNPFLTQMIQNESDYTLDKVYDPTDKKRFRITFAGGDKAYIKLDWLNRIKCNWVHKRYLIQRDPDWFWKTLIAAGIGAMFGIIGSSVGYREGFRDGIKHTKPQSQDTTQTRQ